MRVYFIVYILTLFLNYLIPVHNRSDYLRKLIIVFVPLFLFGALREHFSDQDTYENIYNEIQLLPKFIFDEDAHSEIGYQWLCYIMPSFRTLLVFTTALMCTAYIVFFYKHVPPKALALALNILFLSGNLSIYFVLSSMRNGIAMSLFLIFFSFWQDRKIILATIVTFVAATIHTSALFALPLAFLLGRTSKFTKKELFVWIAFIIFFVVSTATSLINLIAPFINTYFNRYDSVIELGRETGNTFHPLAVVGSVTLFGLLASLISKDSFLTKENFPILRIAMLFSIALIMTALNARLSQYYSPFIVVATAIIYSRFPPIILRKSYIAFVIAYVGYFFYLWMLDRWFVYGVYHSVWGSF